MTQEEKAKAYDEVVARINKAVSDGLVSENFGRDMLGIAKSEDERIRKEIVDFIYWAIDRGSITNEQRERSDSWLAYLEKQKEQNGKNEVDNDFTIYHPLKNGKGEYECIPYSFYGSLTSFSEDKDLIDFLRNCFYTEEECNEWIEKQKEQKPGITEDNPINPFDTKLFQDGVKEGRRLEREDMRKELPLPHNLDEAAEEYGREYVILPDDYNDGDIAFYAEETGKAFKAGAGWMAGQGVILNLPIDELSCGAYNACVEQGLTSEDDVIIQVRKK